LNKSLTTPSNWPSYVVIILVLQVTLYLSFLLNIPVARQVIGFIYLFSIPGFIIVKLLKLNNLGIFEVGLFSVGLSIAFVMIMGLVINEIHFIFDIVQPFEPSLLVLIISGFVLWGVLVCYLRGSPDWQSTGITKGTIVSFFALCLLPVFSVVGAYFANVTGNTFLLLLTLLLALSVFAIAIFSKRLAVPKIYLIIVFAIAITLLFQSSLISNYVQGSDIKGEVYVATLTQSNGFWNVSASFNNLQFGRFYSSLSVTILPAIYSNILDMNITWIFKLIYPLIFALVPLALYTLWRGKFGVAAAFISSFLFISQLTFYTEMLGLARQMIAEVFFVLLILILFSKTLNAKNAQILFVIFGFCLIVSHYSLAIIFAFFISIMWLLGYLTKKPNRYLSFGMVAFFILLNFLWFFYAVSSATITSINADFNYIVSGLSGFFNPASRGTGVLAGIGLNSVSSPLVVVSRTIAYGTEFFIIIGFLVLLFQRKKKDFDFEYFVPCVASMLILVMCILLPGFANTLNITRFYHILLFFLAPLFAIGCIELFRFVSKHFGFAAKRKTEIYSFILMILLLGSYFLFQTNIVYEVTGSESSSLPLSRYRLGSYLYFGFEYVTGPQTSSAKWLSQTSNVSNLVVYADESVSYNLVAYGGIYTSHILPLSYLTAPQHGEFIYLGELGTIYHEFKHDSSLHNLTDTESFSQILAVTYNSGYNKILEATIAAP
jgi:uncharacterized membrane protein